jgi:hypothetical protein
MRGKICRLDSLKRGARKADRESIKQKMIFQKLEFHLPKLWRKGWHPNRLPSLFAEQNPNCGTEAQK